MIVQASYMIFFSCHVVDTLQLPFFTLFLQYYMKNGTCKFGSNCKFDHPREGGSVQPVVLNTSGYPLRPVSVYSIQISIKFLSLLFSISNECFLFACRVRKSVPTISKLAIANLDLLVNTITQNLVSFQRHLACIHQCNIRLSLPLIHIHLLPAGKWGGLLFCQDHFYQARIHQ